jgi:hypothetical protein
MGLHRSDHGIGVARFESRHEGYVLGLAHAAVGHLEAGLRGAGIPQVVEEPQQPLGPGAL